MDNSAIPRLKSVNGPVAETTLAENLSMNEMVEVGEARLVGEVVELSGPTATLQIFEDTTGLAPGAPVYGLGMPLHVELGPGLMGQIFDGIQRPLTALRARWGDFIRRGKADRPLARDKVWAFSPTRAAGETVEGGEVLGEIQESGSIVHRVLVPPGWRGRLAKLAPAGPCTLEDEIGSLELDDGSTRPLRLFHRWPVREARPFRSRLMPAETLVTGQRVIDTFFPVARGGTAAVPGGFGTGKTIIQQQLAKAADADVIVYIGCGERGNEMTEILQDFPDLVDPRSGRPLVERTIFIANTSDMPVAAREASIYTGITIAEYYRDMGYGVALMADSTSRWAEALREISGRMEEMPAEEGFPSYLPSRLAGFYERAGHVVTLGGGQGSVTAIGAISPPGGDFSEPVTMHTKRFVRCLWTLDRELASARYFPAIDYLSSYSGYLEALEPWWAQRAGKGWRDLRERAFRILQEDAKLEKIVRLLGEEALPDDQKLTIEGARLIKEAFLQQSALDPVDAYSSPEKQGRLLAVLLDFIERAGEIVSRRIPVYRAMELPVLETLRRVKGMEAAEDEAFFRKLSERIDQEVDDLLRRHEGPEAEGRKEGA